MGGGEQRSWNLSQVRLSAEGRAVASQGVAAALGWDLVISKFKSILVILMYQQSLELQVYVNHRQET